jgi:two-component system chemotaxis response regulator CheB
MTNSYRYDIVVMAASAGGVIAIGDVLSALPSSFPVPIVLVQHIGPKAHYRSQLVEVLAARAALSVEWAKEGEMALAGRVYIAPQDTHLLIGSHTAFHLSSGHKRNFVCPSADSLFDSVAATYGKRAIAVVLTGTGKDGAEGARRIKQAGGKVIVQDDATSVVCGMPHAVRATTVVDSVLPLGEIAGALVALFSPN